jgi:hypothetical protein
MTSASICEATRHLTSDHKSEHELANYLWCINLVEECSQIQSLQI